MNDVQSPSALSNYAEWLGDLKRRVRLAQTAAVMRVNQELLMLYWDLGREIAVATRDAHYGDAVVEKIVHDLASEFPDMKGFSRQNLFYMRKWYLFYEANIVQQPVGQSATVSDSVIQELVSVPWGHNIMIVTRCKSCEEALFYLRKVREHGWSRTTLEHQMALNLYARHEPQTTLIANFERTLPPLQSDLARQTLKDPYIFDFLTLTDSANERDIERQLTEHITQFLLELGNGFAYVGRQVPLTVGTQEFIMDLLFYHLKLRCYIVIELKAREFSPRDAGQINFYLSAVDEQYKSEHDKPTIGLLLCKGKDGIVAEYALRGMAQPIGIANYELTRAVPEYLRSNLPSIEQVEQELAGTPSEN